MSICSLLAARRMIWQEHLPNGKQDAFESMDEDLSEAGSEREQEEGKESELEEDIYGGFGPDMALGSNVMHASI